MTESFHDREVRRQAEMLAGQGFTVQADIPGYPTPKPIGRQHQTIPDIVATRGGQTRMVEVETSESSKTPHAQQQMSTMNRSAAHRPNTSAKQLIARRGRR